jgi:cytochrome oxidase Cu insertion factor (SCO1/SenC/PrrC family)
MSSSFRVFNHLRIVVGLLCLFLAQQRQARAVSANPSAAEKVTSGIDLMRRDFADKFQDIALINQRGETVRFSTDLVKNRAVVINFFYINCEGACPQTNTRIAQLRRELKPIFGKSISFLSISLDAERDTPAVVARYARMVAGESTESDLPDWQFLTGNAKEIDQLRRHLGFFDPRPEIDQDRSQHGSMLALGNHATGRWAMINATLDTELIVRRIKRITGWTEAQRYEDIRREAMQRNGASHAGHENAAADVSAPPVNPAQDLPILGQITNLPNATERTGETVKLNDLRGKVTVMGQLYTVCPHGSLAVIKAMTALNKAYGERPDFHQVSLATVGAQDTPELFQAYANNLGLTSKTPWWFAIVPPDALPRFLIQDLGLNAPKPIPAEERLNPLDLYENDLRLVLLDRQGRIRGRYSVFHPDPAIGEAAAADLQRAVQQLLNQPAS